MNYRKILGKIGERLIPVKYLTEIGIFLNKAGISKIPSEFIGGLFVFNIPFSLILYFTLLLPYLKYNMMASIPAFIIGFIILCSIEVFTIYFYLDIKIFNRVREIEDLLDKFLQQVSDSLKGGMTFDKALWNSAKVEFGVLSEEIKVIAKMATTGKDVTGALQKFIKKYESPIITRTFSLISESIKSGGKITDILDRIVIDLRETRKLNKEMKTAVLRSEEHTSELQSH